MAYNSFVQYPYGVMPNNSYGMSYAQPQMQYGQQMQSYTQSAQQAPVGIIWVDGEVGAKAYQLPSGWAPNTPLPLWDTNDTVIYLKSTNPMGMPNPLQKIHYTMDEMPKAPMAQPMSGQAALPMPEQSHQDMTGFVTKDDLEKMKQELRDSLSEAVAQTQTNQTQATARKGAKTE